MSESCQYTCHDLAEVTFPDTRSALSLRRCWWIVKKYSWYMSIIGVYGFASKIFPYTKIGEFIFRRKGQAQFVESGDEALNLLPGEWVEVKTAKEIFSTLDQRAKLRGLGFNPEMEKFCGKRFQVYKRVDKIVMESTGELRKIKMPTVLLKEVYCDGKAHGGCDRSCFCYWREAWLRRAPTDQLNQGR